MTSSAPPPQPPFGGAVPPQPHRDGTVPPAYPASTVPPDYPASTVPPDYPASTVPPWPGQGGAVPPAPGYAGEGPPPPHPVAPPPPKKSGLGGKVAGIVGVIAVALVIGLVKFGAFAVVREAFFGDKAKDAAVGDCIKADKEVAVDAETEAGATVVDCGSAEAAFTVAGRVDGVTDTNSTACDKFFADKEEFFVYSSTAGGGYLLCLRPKA